MKGFKNRKRIRYHNISATSIPALSLKANTAHHIICRFLPYNDFGASDVPLSNSDWTTLNSQGIKVRGHELQSGECDFEIHSKKFAYFKENDVHDNGSPLVLKVQHMAHLSDSDYHIR